MNDIRSICYFRKLKNRHRGQRGFVVGNGPSLRMEDLSRLQNEVTIASNKIYLAFAQTSWRPSYYTLADLLVWNKIKHHVHEYIDTIHTPGWRYPQGCQAKSYQWTELGCAAFSTPDEMMFSDDLTKGAYGGYTITFENLQFAAHLGLNPIYLIGCDHFYRGETDSTHDQPIQAGPEFNHFIANYRMPGEVVNPAPINLMTQAFQHAKAFAEWRGIEIANATRGGHLEVFNRCNFDELLA